MTTHYPNNTFASCVSHVYATLKGAQTGGVDDSSLDLVCNPVFPMSPQRTNVAPKFVLVTS
jgi:hypothetical protein